MGLRIECDICEKSVTPDHRVIIQHPVAWEDFYDVCDDCWDEHLEPIVNGVARKHPKRIADRPRPAPETTGPGTPP